jgi:hypothetical protein
MRGKEKSMMMLETPAPETPETPEAPPEPSEPAGSES